LVFRVIRKIRENLYLGDEESPQLLSELEPVKPNVILDLRGWRFDVEPMTDDGRLYINRLLHVMSTAIWNDIPVLVHCHGAMDRSPFLVACWLWFEYLWEQDENGLDAYDEIKKIHPQTIIHDDWIRWYTYGQ